MKILLVCENIPAPMLGGLGKHVVMLGNALIEQGHEVALLGLAAPSYDACAAEIGFRGRFIAGLPFAGKGWKEAALGCFNPFKRPHYAARFAQAIVRWGRGFDVVHYHGHLPLVGAFLPADLPFVQTRHDQGSDCLTHLRFRQGEVCTELDPRACAACATAHPNALQTAVSAAAARRYRALTARAFARHPVLFVSDFLLANARRTLPASAFSQAHVVHAFIDETRLPAASSAPASSAAPVPLDGDGDGDGRPPVRLHVAGRIDDAKGVLAFMAQLMPRLPAHWRVDVFGEGPRRTDLERLVDARVTLHGHRPVAEVLASCATATLAVVPSQWEEPWGNVTAEALRLGVPCYALRRGGTPELARYGAPGQLRLFASMAALVDALVADVDAAAPLPEPITARGPQAGESADVRQRLHQIIPIYEATARRAR